MSELFLIPLVLACIGLEGLFSGGEIALISADIHRVRQRAESDSRAAAIALKLLDNPEWFLTTCLMGTNLCVITSTALATSFFLQTLGPSRGEWVSVAVMIPSILIFGEIVPKSYFRHRAEQKAVLIAPFIWAASWVFWPFVFVISRIARGTLYALAGQRGRLSLPYITKDGLKYLLHEEAVQTDVKRSEKEMVDRIFDFSDTSVGRVMVPLSNVAAIGEEAAFGDAARLFSETGFSRVPVYQGSVINVIGIVHAFDVLKDMPASSSRPVRAAMRQALFVPVSKPIDELLPEMQRRGEPMAVVVDEYGGAVGIVTIEDILEEIVGDIRDEYDKRERDVRRLASGRYLVNARIGIERLREVVPLDVPQGPYETLAGYLLHQMGRIPRRMEQFRAGGVQFVIEDADLKSIKQVQVILPADNHDAKKDEGPAESGRPVTGL